MTAILQHRETDKGVSEDRNVHLGWYLSFVTPSTKQDVTK